MTRPFSVILCTRNRPGPVIRAVESILAGGDLAEELWIMDQSDDDATAVALAGRFPNESRLRHVRLPYANKSRAANAAARASVGAFLAFTDDDCVIEAHWLERMHADFERHASCAAVLGGIIPGNRSTRSVVPLEYDHDGAVVGSPADYWNLGICGGGNVAVRRQAYIDVGGMDEAMGPGARMHGAEDLDLFYRLLIAGHALFKDQTVAVRHYSERLANGGRRLGVVRRYACGMAAFHMKHLRCGDGRSARYLSRYVAGNMSFNVEGLLRSFIRPGGWRDTIHCAAAIGAHPAWVIYFALKHALVPIERRTRMYV